MKLQKDPPSVLFLQETKCSNESTSAIMARIWKNYITIAIDAQGASGSLSISWNPHIISLDYALAARHSISASFHILGSSIKGFLMNVYGPQNAGEKKNLLKHIDWFRTLHIDSPIIIGGYFNMISNFEEKKGASDHSQGRMKPSIL